MSSFSEELNNLKKYSDNINNIVSGICNLKYEIKNIDKEYKDIENRILNIDYIKRNDLEKSEKESKENIREQNELIDKLSNEKDEKINNIQKEIGNKRRKEIEKYDLTARELMTQIVILERKNENLKEEIESNTFNDNQIFEEKKKEYNINFDKISKLSIECKEIIKQKKLFNEECLNDKDSLIFQEQLDSINAEYKHKIDKVINEYQGIESKNGINNQYEESIRNYKLKLSELSLKKNNVKNEYSSKEEMLRKALNENNLSNFYNADIEFITEKNNNSCSLPTKIFGSICENSINIDGFSGAKIFELKHFDVKDALFISIEQGCRGENLIESRVYNIIDNMISDLLSNIYYRLIKIIVIDEKAIEDTLISNMQRIGSDLREYKKYDVIETILDMGISTEEIINKIIQKRCNFLNSKTIDEYNKELEDLGSDNICKYIYLFVRVYKNFDFTNIKQLINKCKSCAIIPIVFIDKFIFDEHINLISKVIETFSNNIYYEIIDKNELVINKIKI